MLLFQSISSDSHLGFFLHIILLSDFVLGLELGRALKLLVWIELAWIIGLRGGFSIPMLRAAIGTTCFLDFADS